MKWFKHGTVKTKITDKLIDNVGIDGYGRYYLLLETVIGHLDSPDDDSGLQLSLKKWAELLRFKSKNVVSYFDCLKKLGLILYQRIQDDLLVQIVKLSELVTKSAISSKLRSTAGSPREEEKERITLFLEKNEKNLIECPITKAAKAAKESLV